MAADTYKNCPDRSIIVKVEFFFKYFLLPGSAVGFKVASRTAGLLERQMRVFDGLIFDSLKAEDYGPETVCTTGKGLSLLFDPGIIGPESEAADEAEYVGISTGAETLGHLATIGNELLSILKLAANRFHVRGAAGVGVGEYVIETQPLDNGYSDSGHWAVLSYVIAVIGSQA